MFKINTDPEIQFGITLKDLVEKLPCDIRRNLSYWQLVNNLLAAFNRSENATSLWRGLWESVIIEAGIGEDVFAFFNQEVSTKSRSHTSEYFTPRALTELVAKRTAERLYYLDSIQKSDCYKILEPTCGTGAMVLSLIRYVYLTRPDFLPKLQFIVNDISSANINSTKLNYEIQLAKGLQLRPLIAHNGDAHDLLLKYKGQINAVIGNPPFHKMSTLSLNQECAEQLKTCYQMPEDAFILAGELTNGKEAKETKLRSTSELPETIQEMAVRLLCPFGVSLLYLPNSILSNKKNDGLRKFLLDGNVNGIKHSILSVTGFPSETFCHSGTGVRVSLLEVMTGESMTPNNDGIMMGLIENIGWDTRLRMSKSELPDLHVMDAAILDSYKLRVRRCLIKQNTKLTTKLAA